LGRFLTSIAVFSQVANDFTSLYEQVLSAHGVGTPLRRVSMHMNLPTNLMQQSDITRQRRLLAKEAASEILKGKLRRGEAQDDPPSLDLIPIVLLDMSFCYNIERPIFSRVHASVPQGSLVAITGGREAGKVTLLRLLGHNIFPTQGDIVVPTHVRYIYVSAEPYIIDASPWHNLVYGRPQARRSRVKEVVRLMGLESLMPFLEKDLANRGSPRRRVGESWRRCRSCKCRRWLQVVRYSIILREK